MQIKQSTIFWLIIISAGIFAIHVLSPILMPFIFGVVVAYFLNPLVNYIEGFKVSKTHATLAVLGGAMAILIGSVYILGPIFIDQISNLINKIPEYTASLQKQYGEAFKGALKEYAPHSNSETKEIVSKFSGEILSLLASVLQGLISSGAAIFSLLSLILISPIVAFYMLRDWSVIIKKIDDLLPREKLSMFRKNFQKIDRIISAYIRGQVMVCLTMALFYSISLSIVGVNYGFAIGFLTGMLSFIPYVGMFVGALAGLGVAYSEFGFSNGLISTLIVFVFGNLIEGNFVTPKLVGGAVELHPAWVIFALLAGGALFGFTGILIAIPAAAVLGVITRSSVEGYKQSALYLGVNPDDIQTVTINEDALPPKEDSQAIGIFKSYEQQNQIKDMFSAAEQDREKKSFERRIIVDSKEKAEPAPVKVEPDLSESQRAKRKRQIKEQEFSFDEPLLEPLKRQEPQPKYSKPLTDRFAKPQGEF